MSARLREHLLYRLRHDARRQAVDRALERGLLAKGAAAAVSAKSEHKHSRRNKVDPEDSFTFGLSADDNDNDADARTPQRLTLGPLLLDKTRREAAIILQRSGMALPGGSFDPETLVTVTEVLGTVRASAVPHADEVAVMLLIAGAVGQARLSDEAWRSCLRRRDWQAAIRSPVEGFQVRLVRMLKEGSFAHPVGVYSGADMTADTTALPGRFKRGRTVILFRGIEDGPYAGTAVQDKVGFAARLALPVLGLADEAEHLPLRLCRAADLRLATGPLTAAIVHEVLHAVLGSAPVELPENLTDALAAALSIHDLAAAVRPGLEPQAVLATLVRLAQKDGDDARRHGKSAGDAGSAKADADRWSGWRNGGSDKASSKAGAVSSGSEIIKPAKLADDGSASPIAGDPGLPAPPTVETLHGYGKASNWALDLKLDLALWQAGKLPWSQMSTRLLLSGLPGTGKTTFARALCNTLQVPLVATSVSTWLEPSHLGDVIKRMRIAFEEAQNHAPAILFVDEIDGIGRRGQNEYDDYWNSVVNKLLELMDGTTRSDGLIIVGATNHPDVIDPAIRRSGRLETHIEIPLPDVDALVGILAHHLGSDCPTVIATKPHRETRQEEAAVRRPAPLPPTTNPLQMEPDKC